MENRKWESFLEWLYAGHLSDETMRRLQLDPVGYMQGKADMAEFRRQDRRKKPDLLPRDEHGV